MGRAPKVIGWVGLLTERLSVVTLCAMSSLVS
jgi:hypothetical protein